MEGLNFDKIENIKDLEDILKKRGCDHNNYSFYMPSKYYTKKNIENIRLTNGKTWNDVVDSKNIHSDNKIRFVKCFTYSQSENIAMWMLYGGCNDKGRLIRYTKKQVNDLCNSSKINIYTSNDQFLLEVAKEQVSIYLIDIIYIDKENNKNTDSESTKSNKYSFKMSKYGINSKEIKGFDVDLDNDKLKYYCKRYAWSYENECRLIVEIDKDFLNNKFKEYNQSNSDKYSLDDDLYILLNVNSKKVTVITSPLDNNVCMEEEKKNQDVKLIKESILKNKLNWDLKKEYLNYFFDDNCDYKFDESEKKSIIKLAYKFMGKNGE